MFPEDYELWLRLHAAGQAMAKLPEVLLDWRDSPGRVSRTSARYARTAFDTLRAEYLARDARLQGRDLVVWGAGRRTRKRVEHLLARGTRPRAWIDVDPKKIGNRINGLSVLGPTSLEQGARPLVLVYVASHGAREQIGEHLVALGYVEGVDYLAVG
jgi:FlaA1/EpsC-like NDP-sugar epimerase